MSKSQTHSALESLRYRDDVLLWGGQEVPAIADLVGQTPFYTYDRQLMTDRVNRLRSVLPSRLRLHYAMKANPMPEVVQHMASLVDGLDVASAGELAVALGTSVDPADVSFAGPGKKDSELVLAAQSGIAVNLESENEMRRLARIGADLGKRPKVAIRVNPQFELKSSGMKMGGRPSPFGVDAELVPAMLAEVENLDLEFTGFHIFSGSQNLRVGAFEESLQKTTALVIELADSTSLEVKYVNLGGGLGIPYFANEAPLDIEQLSSPMEAAVDSLYDELGNPEVVIELGRYFVGEAGLYVCRVVDIKESRATKFVVTDGGLHHHLAASGNFGQVLRKNYPIAAVVRNDEYETVSVVGPLCTPLDLLGNQVSLPKLEIGSLVVVLQSGAYGKTASPEMFLSHPPCREIFI